MILIHLCSPYITIYAIANEDNRIFRLAISLKPLQFRFHNFYLDPIQN